jgi:hypothetical protein
MIVISTVRRAIYGEWRAEGPRNVRVNLLAPAIPAAAIAVRSMGNRV